MIRTGDTQAHANPENWAAKWIYSSEAGPNDKNRYVLLRNTLNLERLPKEFKIAVSADALYKLYVNGRYIGRGPVRSVSSAKYYEVYDIAGALQEGENVVCAVAYTYGSDFANYETQPLRSGFILQSLSDDTLHTDAGWRAMVSTAWRTDTQPISHCRAYEEYYDAREEPAGWLLPGYDDSSWKAAEEISPATGGIWKALRPRETPMQRDKILLPAKVILCGSPVQKASPSGPNEEYGMGRILRCERTGPLKEASVEDATALTSGGGCIIKPGKGGADVTLLLDFGQEVSGFPFMEIESAPGVEIDFGWAEALDSHGDLDTLHPKPLGYGGRYITSGRAGERWEFYHAAAFRYMQVVLRSVTSPVTVKSIGVNYSTYPVERRGTFTCSDDRLNQIMDLCAHTLELCMDDSYMDCPTRERAQWLADAVVQFRTGYPVFGDHRLARKMLLDFMESQNEQGRILSVFPSTATYDRWIPGFACLLAHGYRYYREVSGDTSLDAKFLPCMEKLIGHFTEYLKDGLITDIEGWAFFDWQPLLHVGPRNILFDLFFILLLKESAAVAESGGDEALFGKWSSLAGEVRQAVLRTHWDESRGLLRDNPGEDEFSEHANAFAIYAGILEEEKQKRVAERLALPENGLIPTSTPYFKFWLIETLFESGCHKQILDMIRQEWWGMIEDGATSTWETSRKMQSLCHAWSAGPAYWFVSRILGIRTAGSKVLVQPFLGDLDWARGSACTPLGPVTVQLGQGRVCVSLPDGAEGLLDLSLLRCSQGERSAFTGSLDVEI